jgi:hypothetical protein
MLKRWRVREVWRCTAFAYVEAATREEAEMKLEEGEGDFDHEAGEWEYVSTISDVEEIP